MTGVKVLLCCKQTNSLEQIIINNVDSIVRRWYTRMRGNMGGDGGKVLELVKEVYGVRDWLCLLVGTFLVVYS